MVIRCWSLRNEDGFSVDGCGVGEVAQASFRLKSWKCMTGDMKRLAEKPAHIGSGRPLTDEVFENDIQCCGMNEFMWSQGRAAKQVYS